MDQWNHPIGPDYLQFSSLPCCGLLVDTCRLARSGDGLPGLEALAATRAVLHIGSPAWSSPRLGRRSTLPSRLGDSRRPG